MSGPNTSRSMCGTIKPTNAIIPLTATATPVIRDAAVSNIGRTTRTLTPIDLASSSPIISRLRSLANATITPPPTRISGPDNHTWSQDRESSPPASQKRMPLRVPCSGSAMMTSVISAPMNALTATPARISVATENRPLAIAIAYTRKAVPIAPPSANRGRARKNNDDAPVAMAITAAAAPPDATPIVPGSASGLRKRACIAAPATPSAMPTSAPTTIRGMRIRSTTSSSVWL